MTAHFTDREGDRLLKLSDEMSQIAGKLTRLASDPSGGEQSLRHPLDTSDLTAKRVRAVIEARRLRSRFFPDDLFADPAWDMLLELLFAELVQHRVAVSSLCIAAAVPPTTALRWLNTLVEHGLVVRRSDPHDGRRVFVELSNAASAALRGYFSKVGSGAIG